jgi:hypothetical protein
VFLSASIICGQCWSKCLRKQTSAQLGTCVRILNSLDYWYCCMSVLLAYFMLDPTNSDSPPAMLWPATTCVVPVWNAVF